jgi:hypothetical protein
VHAQTEAVGNGTEFLEFSAGVDRAQLRRLGNAQGTGLGVMDIAAAVHDLFYLFSMDLAVIGMGQQDFGTVGEEFRSSALVGFDMGDASTDDAVVTAAEGCQGQTVGGRAIEGEENLAIGLEQVADPIGGCRRETIFTIGRASTVVRLGQRRQGLWAHTGVVVAGEGRGAIDGIGVRHGRLHRLPVTEPTELTTADPLLGAEREPLSIGDYA